MYLHSTDSTYPSPSAAHAAHDLGENLCMYLRNSEQYDPSSTSPWTVFSTKPFLPGPSRSLDTGPDTSPPRGFDQSPPNPQIASAAAAGSSTSYITPGSNVNNQPQQRIKQDMAVLSERLKTLASEWHQKLEECRSTTSSRAGTPYLQDQPQQHMQHPSSQHSQQHLLQQQQQQQQRLLTHQQRPQLPAPVACGPLHEGVYSRQLAQSQSQAQWHQDSSRATPMRTSDEESFDHYPSSAYSLEFGRSQQQLQQQIVSHSHQAAQLLVVKCVQDQQCQQQQPFSAQGSPQIDRSFDLMLSNSMDFGAQSSAEVKARDAAGCPNNPRG